MKLLLDQNLSYRIIKPLVEVYADSTQVGLLAMGDATDKDIWEYGFRFKGSKPFNFDTPVFFKVVVAFFNQATFFISSFSGFNATAPTGLQLRVFPDQRSGILDLADA